MTKKPPSNLTMRVLTALIAVPLMLLLLYRGEPWGFYLLALPAVLVGSFELLSMTHPLDRASRFLGALLAGVVSVLFYVCGHEPRVVLTLLVVVPVTGLFVTLARLGDLSTAAFRAFAMSVAPLYVALPLTCVAVLRRDAGADGPGLVVMMLGFAWLSDTGGYFAGRFLGRHKLYEAVSPKKTVEGALGGLAGSVLSGIAGHAFLVRGLSLGHAIVLGLVAGALGQAGDLAESLIKRSTGVKDSGQIVPGHGGVLDRVDAVLLVGIVVYLDRLWF